MVEETLEGVRAERDKARTAVQALVDEALNLIDQTARRQIRRGNLTAFGMHPDQAEAIMSGQGARLVRAE